MDRQNKIDLLNLINERDRRRDTSRIYRMYPETGPLRRELYVPHCKFFEAGRNYRERCIIAANRIGKSEGVGGYELTLHLTGDYPDWWQGRRFDRPVRAWAAGTTGQTVRDIIQQKLLGDISAIGTGLIPKKLIKSIKRKAGNVPDTIESVEVQHKTGGISRLGFKSYDQKRKAFEGAEKDIIWLDEEPDQGIYTECLVRTMTTNGLIMLTFTPLMGLSDVVLQFLPGGRFGQDTGRFVIGATWDDAPHLGKAEKDELWESIPIHQRDARSKGIPQLGSGAIYPLPEEQVAITDFEMPNYWPRIYGMDVGWNWTAAVWGAHDRDNDILYLYSVYKQGQSMPPVHSEAILSRGAWIPGAIDPASQGSNQKDGTKLIDVYKDLGLQLFNADNAVEAGIHQFWLKLSTGRVKIFKSCVPWFEEYRLYRRDEKGKVVKVNDHLMDCTRYLNMSLLRAEVIPPALVYSDMDFSEMRNRNLLALQDFKNRQSSNYNILTDGMR